MNKVKRRLELVETNKTANHEVRAQILDRGEDQTLDSCRRPSGVAGLGLEVDGGGDGGFGRPEAKNVLELGNWWREKSARLLFLKSLRTEDSQVHALRQRSSFDEANQGLDIDVERQAASREGSVEARKRARNAAHGRVGDTIAVRPGALMTGFRLRT